LLFVVVVLLLLGCIIVAHLKYGIEVIHFNTVRIEVHRNVFFFVVVVVGGVPLL
jgi:hypothetical protein